MSIVRAAIAASAACLLGAAAYAQPMDNGQGPAAAQPAAPADQASPPDQTAAPAPAPNGQMGAPADQQGADQQGMSAGAPNAAGAAANASVTTNAQGVEVISSQPVPDTPQNRAQYGQPMSRTGRLTQPAGN